MKRLALLSLQILFWVGFFGLSPLAAQVEEDPTSFYWQGLSHLEKKEYLQAIRHFTTAISLNNAYAEAYYQRAIAKNALNKELGYLSIEHCHDLIKAMNGGKPEAAEMLLEHVAAECFSLQAAKMQPKIVFCADFSTHGLTEIPANITDFPFIVQLNLAENELTTLDSALARLENVLVLDLNNNRLNELSANFSQLSHLQFLNLSDNNLKELNSDFGNLKNLRVLQIKNNYLSELPLSFEKLENLENLDISYNQLSQVPAVLLRLQNLRELHIEGNAIPKEEIEKIRTALPKTEIFF
ncbi:leucine-rich repeat domain-containing protein [Hugenholtzia roseola]|uniref:leucine-rich repeat domain-containing protein n=1 Tax=Hugenholtzia roseola TaxID=1002 RepID=UPI0006865F1D|nr:leucine-rich repeat domain-containing protein [Hugenholtzia roseola]